MLLVGVDLVEESVQMIGGLQMVACMQSSQKCTQWSELGKDDTPLMIFAWNSC